MNAHHEMLALNLSCRVYYESGRSFAKLQSLATNEGAHLNIDKPKGHFHDKLNTSNGRHMTQ